MKRLTINLSLKYIWVECKKNKSLVWYINQLTINKCMLLQNIKFKYLHFVFDPCMSVWWWLYCWFYYHIERLIGRLIIWILFDNKYFVRNQMNILLIFEVGWLFVTCKMVVWLLLSMCVNFSRWSKNGVWWLGFKKYYNLFAK